ncbi:MAG: hypothetical protein C4292_04935 [Nitrososphaera sp.]
MERHLVVGLVLASAGSLLAIVLNFMGASCLSELARLQNRQEEPLPTRFAELERDCFIITNSYVYSLFAAIAGAVILVVYRLKSKNWRPRRWR